MSTQTLLPAINTEAEFEALKPDRAIWEPAIAQLGQRHALVGEAEPLDGSCVLFAVGDGVIKLFQPWDLDLFDTEVAVLRHLHGRLGLPTPALLAQGLLEGWGYVVMSKLPGRALEQGWTELPLAARRSLAAELGRAAAALHRLPVAGLPPLAMRWADFLPKQRAKCIERHRSHGVSEAILAELPALLAEPLPAEGMVLLHTELTSHNVLFDVDGDGAPRLSGLCDFEPAMLGAPEYDLVAIAIFLARGDGSILRAALEAYGYAPDQIDRGLQRRLLAYTLLHRYSHLGFFLGQVPGEHSPGSLEELADLLVPIGQPGPPW